MPDGKLTINLVKDSLLNENARRKKMGESSSKVLTIKKEKKNKEKARVRIFVKTLKETF